MARIGGPGPVNDGLWTTRGLCTTRDSPQLAAAVLAAAAGAAEELESEPEEDPLSDLAGSLAVDAPPRLSVR
jgi:hypothetical protein